MGEAVIGYAEMPADFRYADVFWRGKPRHGKFDDFRRKHPPMPPARWAKIYAPFDALAGLDNELKKKQVVYRERRILSDGEKEELDRTLSFLYSLISGRERGSAALPAVTVTYFEPCTDECSEWFGTGGTYVRIEGTVSRINPEHSRCIVIRSSGGDRILPLEDVTSIDISGDSLTE